MNINIDEVYGKFPMASYRDGQKDAIDFVVSNINAGKKFIILEMPTGSGKSPIAVALARSFDSAYYITASKQLQDQSNADFGEGGKHGEYIITLKGRNAYECTYKKRKAAELLANKTISKSKAFEWQNKYCNCTEGKCREVGVHRFNECIENGWCGYYTQVDKAVTAKIVAMNFSSYLYQTIYTDRFGKRNVLIIDEAHQCEPQLMNFVTLSLSNRDIPQLQIPQYETPEEYVEWVKTTAQNTIKVEILKATNDEDPERVENLQSLLERCEFFLAAMSSEPREPWVCEYSSTDRYDKVEFKPIYIHKYAEKYLFSMADVVIMMSATILNVNVFIKSLGIPKEQMIAKRCASRFPPKNHPIYYKPVVKVTGGTAQIKTWGPPLIKEVNRIVKKHAGQRGIIHTHNFAICKLLLEECAPSVTKRFLYQRDFKDKTEMLEAHKLADDTVIVAPAMHEGVDLYDDLSRFQIICKVPFPNHFEDKQLAARMEEDENYYRWLTALKIVQAVGRSVRSETDHAETYIIDSSFGWWSKQNESILPAWFKNSIVT